MQKLVGFALEVAVVEHVHQRVLVGLLDGHAAVRFVQSLSAGLCPAHLGAVDRLAAAHDASAGAGHDLNEVVLLLAGFHGLQHLPGVCQTGSHADLHIQTVVGNAEFPDALIAPCAALRDRTQGCRVVALDQTAQNRFRHAAGSAEDHAAAGADAEGHIAGFGRKRLKVDAVGVDHPDQLGGGEHVIRVLPLVGVALLALRLHFLGGTGHDGDYDGLFPLGVGLVPVVILQDCGEHGLRRTAGGDIFLEFRILVLHELDPRGAAGGHQWQIGASLDPLQKFRGLFHNGQVGGVGGVEDLVEAHAVQRRYDLAHGVLALGQTEGFTDGHADGGSDLGDHAGVLVTQRLPDVGHVVVNGQGAGGADHAALSAADAVGHSHLAVEGGGHGSVRAAVGKGQNADPLKLRARPDTAAAQDALVGVADDGGRGKVYGLDLPVIFKADIVDAQLVGQLLQLAPAVLVTGGAVPAVGGQQQLHDELAVLAQTLGMGVDHHAVPGFFRAGGEEAASVVLHHAQTAGAENGQLRLVAQGRDLETGLANDGQNILLVGKFYLFSVDCNSTHDCPPYASM